MGIEYKNEIYDYYNHETMIRLIRLATSIDTLYDIVLCLYAPDYTNVDYMYRDYNNLWQILDNLTVYIDLTNCSYDDIGTPIDNNDYNCVVDVYNNADTHVAWIQARMIDIDNIINNSNDEQYIYMCNMTKQYLSDFRYLLIDFVSEITYIINKYNRLSI